MPTRWIKRKCNVCGVIKDCSELVPSKRYRDGYMPCCKSCRNEYWRKRRKESPEARKKHSEAVRRSRLLSDYGITQAVYKQMLSKQGNVCALCGSSSHGRGIRFRYWNVDHSHTTGTVRGLLCHSCNICVGKLEVLAAKIGLSKILKYIEE